MKKLLAAAALYAAAYTAVAFAWLSWTNAAVDRSRRAVELAEAQAVQLKGPETLLALREACRDKLEPGDSRTIAAYIARTAVKPTDDNHWDEALLGVHRVFDEDQLATVPSNGFHAVTLERALLESLNPLEWVRHLSQARAGEPDLTETRYLLVAKYFSLTLPVNQGTDGYTRGGGDYAARVLAFPTGEVLCEGRGEVHMKETVSASARAATPEAAQADALTNAAKLVPFVFSQAVMTSPLHALCDVGGESLCRLTAQWVGR